jgi:hypothetical protein
MKAIVITMVMAALATNTAHATQLLPNVSVDDFQQLTKDTLIDNFNY